MGAQISAMRSILFFSLPEHVDSCSHQSLKDHDSYTTKPRVLFVLQWSHPKLPVWSCFCPSSFFPLWRHPFWGPQESNSVL